MKEGERVNNPSAKLWLVTSISDFSMETKLLMATHKLGLTKSTWGWLPPFLLTGYSMAKTFVE